MRFNLLGSAEDNNVLGLTSEAPIKQTYDSTFQSQLEGESKKITLL